MQNEAQKKTDLQKWQERFSKNKAAHESELAAIDKRDALYNGSDKIDGYDGNKAKDSKYTRNIVAENIESEVDSSIPAPKVTAKREQDEDNAKTIEAFLRNEMDYLPFEEINDMDERTTPIQGGDYFLVEWDNDRRTHTTLGGINVTLLHPRQVIPQSGVTQIEDMDYIFVMTGMTKKAVKRTYGIDVKEETEEFPDARSNGGNTEKTAEDMVTLITAFYRNSDGGIGVYRWVGDTEVQNLKDYFARQIKQCKKCGCEVSNSTDKCPECGSKSFEKVAQDNISLDRDITLNDGSTIKQMTDGEYQDSIQFDDNGDMVMAADGNPLSQLVTVSEPEPNTVPLYKIRQYPIVLRRNISKNNSLLGGSDVDTMYPMQELIKKLGTKIQEKLLKGGSYVTFPKGARIKKTDEELKVIELSNITDKNMIDVINVQPNIANDVSYMDNIYQSAREAIGITDSFQGRSDKTAQSGTAKQFAAAQTAGRLESKRVMKQAAYQELFKLMFKFMLAFADEARDTNVLSGSGTIEYGQFDRYAFLERDASGELYWNDDFLFSVDTTNNLAQNREQLWQNATDNWKNGAFGEPTQLKSRILYWTLMEAYHYPMAVTVKGELLKEQQELEEQMEQQQSLQGGMQNAMPDMQIGNVASQGLPSNGQPVQPNIQMPQPTMQQV